MVAALFYGVIPFSPFYNNLQASHPYILGVIQSKVWTEHRWNWCQRSQRFLLLVFLLRSKANWVRDYFAVPAVLRSPNPRILLYNVSLGNLRWLATPIRRQKSKQTWAAQQCSSFNGVLLAVLLYRLPSRQRSPLQFSMGTYRSNINRHRTQHLVLPLSELQEIIGLAQSDLLEAQGTLQIE